MDAHDIETKVGTLLSTEIHLPSKQEAEREAGEIALTWATTFAATFGVLAKPALDAGSLGATRAVLVAAAIAGATAGARACKPLVLKALRSMTASKTPSA